MAALSRLSSMESPVLENPQPSKTIYPKNHFEEIKKWEYPDGSFIHVARKGDELIFIANMYGVISKGMIGLEDQDPDIFCDALKDSDVVPYLKENRLRFIHPMPSLLDTNQKISFHKWAVTMLCVSSSLGYVQASTKSKCYWAMAGHAALIVETIHDENLYSQFFFDLRFTNNRVPNIYENRMKAGKHYAEIREKSDRIIDPSFSRIGTFVIDAFRIQQMIDHIRAKIAIIANPDTCVEESILYSATNPVPESNIHSCFTFCIDSLQVAGIDLRPLFHERFYIPSMDVKPFSELCKRAIRKNYPIARDLAPYEGIVDKNMEKKLEELKEHTPLHLAESVKIATLVTIASPFLTIVAPFAVIGAWTLVGWESAATVRRSYLMNKIEEKRKIKALEMQLMPK